MLSNLTAALTPCIPSHGHRLEDFPRGPLAFRNPLFLLHKSRGSPLRATNNPSQGGAGWRKAGGAGNGAGSGESAPVVEDIKEKLPRIACVIQLLLVVLLFIKSLAGIKLPDLVSSTQNGGETALPLSSLTESQEKMAREEAEDAAVAIYPILHGKYETEKYVRGFKDYGKQLWDVLEAFGVKGTTTIEALLEVMWPYIEAYRAIKQSVPTSESTINEFLSAIKSKNIGSRSSTVTKIGGGLLDSHAALFHSMLHSLNRASEAKSVSITEWEPIATALFVVFHRGRQVLHLFSIHPNLREFFLTKHFVCAVWMLSSYFTRLRSLKGS